MLFVSLAQQYMFRNSGRDDYRMDGFRLEDKNSLDVVLIGASEIYTGFSSAYAYELQGFTSYPYAVAAGPVTLWKTMLTETLSRQNPQVIVVEVNGAVYNKPEDLHSNAAMHYVLDRMPLGANKIQAVKTLVTDDTDDAICFFVPLIKYHSNWQNLKELKGIAGSVLMQNMRGHTLLKGVSTSLAIVPPEAEMMDLKEDYSEKPLDEEAEQYFRDFLEFCQSKNLQVLFTRFPHQIQTKGTGQLYPNFQKTNTMEKIVAEYGFPFLNMERLFDEIGLDPDKDFYNPNHLNIYGQRKLTEFLSRYLVDNFDLTPHELTESQKAAWEESAEYYERFCRYIEGRIAENTEEAIAETRSLIRALEAMETP